MRLILLNGNMNLSNTTLNKIVSLARSFFSAQQSTITVITVLLILLGVAARFFPHPANFTPIGALALFGGLYLPRRIALPLPIGAMLVSDLFIGFYHWQMMLAVYGSFLLMVGIGLLIRQKKHLGTLLGGTLLGSLLFFLITNATVWGFGTMYPHTFDGLLTSYAMGIPFFKYTLLGDLFYTGVLVGGMEALLWYKNRVVLKTSTRISTF